MNRIVTPEWVFKQVMTDLTTSVKFLRAIHDYRPPTDAQLAASKLREEQREADHRAALVGEVCRVEWSGGDLVLVYACGRTVTIYGVGYEADGVDWSTEP